jgi:flagellar M-ring protein FliF
MSMPATVRPSAAALPATDAMTAAAAAQTAVAKARQPMVERARTWVQEPAVRRALPGILALVVLLLMGGVYALMQATPYRPLMAGMMEADQQAAFEALTKADFKPRLEPATGQLTVPADRYHEARILLASQGLPRGGTTGLDALKEQSSMTTSQFMEQVRVNAAIEQELARSIIHIATVQSARVHLATPKQSVFVRDRTPPKAAVVVSPHPGRMVSPTQVQAIVHLVASSVPYLSPDQVTVVDNVGKLLTESATELKLGLTAAQSQHKQQIEELYRSRIVQILAPMVGENNVRSQVNLTLDFTQIESTSEDFDTREKGPRTRSEVLAEDRGTRRDAEGIPGALANTPPPAPAATPETAVEATRGQTESTDKLSSRITRNYEIDRTVRHTRNASGGVQRLSVAVVVNERPAPTPAKGATEEAAKSVSFSPEEMERMLELVRQVVGYEQERGDLITLVPARFEAQVPLETLPWYLDPDLRSLVRNGLLGFLFLVFLLVVVWPLMRLLTRKGDSSQASATALPDGELSEDDMRMIQLGEGDSIEDIKAKLKPRRSGITADMLDTANTYDDKVALIRMLVVEDSGRVANVLKNMIKAA